MCIAYLVLFLIHAISPLKGVSCKRGGVTPDYLFALGGTQQDRRCIFHGKVVGVEELHRGQGQGLCRVKVVPRGAFSLGLDRLEQKIWEQKVWEKLVCFVTTSPLELYYLVVHTVWLHGLSKADDVAIEHAMIH